MPCDDTIPQSTEGDEYLTHAIKPTSALNVLLITFQTQICTDTAKPVAVALFQDSGANALAAKYVTTTAANVAVHAVLIHSMVAGTTSQTTLKVRLGPHGGGTVYINGSSVTRVMGGVASTTITIMEIAA